MKKIGLGADHAGFELKNHLKNYLKEKGFVVKDYGTYDGNSCDYSDFSLKTANGVIAKEVDFGVLVCGTGIGISLGANKIKGIRCASCSDMFSAKMSRAHNDCNMIAIGARVLNPETAEKIIYNWINTEFEQGRHSLRVNKIIEIENKNFK